MSRPFFYVPLLRPFRLDRVLINALSGWQLGRGFWRSLSQARGYTR